MNLGRPVKESDVFGDPEEYGQEDTPTYVLLTRIHAEMVRERLATEQGHDFEVRRW